MTQAAERLAAAARALIAEAVSSELPEEALADAATALDALAQRLREAGAGRPRRFAMGRPEAVEPVHYLRYSPMAGPLNPLAPPLHTQVRDGEVHATVTFGRAYEGPPGYVHGGILAAAFDDVLGFANTVSGNPGMTVRLEVRYRRPTPIAAPALIIGRHTGRQGRRISASATLLVGGEVAAEADGVFAEITPARAMALFAGALSGDLQTNQEEVDDGAAL